MIKIEDSIIRHINDLQATELKTYLVLNRYITEKEDIYWDKIIKILPYGDHIFEGVLKSLVDKRLLGFKESGTGFTVEDLLSGRSGLLTGPKKSRSLFILLTKETLNNTGERKKDSVSKSLQKKTNKKNKQKKQIKEKEDVQSGVPDLIWPDSKTFHVKFQSTIQKAQKQAIQSGSRKLVEHFTNTLYNLTAVSRSKRWRHTQLSVAKRLLKEHDLSLAEWIDAVDFFTKQDFWKDKLNSLLQVEKNLQQWSFNRKKKPKKTSDVKFKRV